MNSEHLGHFLVQLQSGEDPYVALSSADWKNRFASVTLTDEMWDSLSERGFWTRVNATCGTLLDQYEEEEFTGEKLNKLIAVIDEYAAQSSECEADFLRALRRLAGRAREQTLPLLAIL